MAFDGTEGCEITLAQGAAMTKAHRKKSGSGIKGHFYGKNILNRLLDQDGCVGIRMYHALHSETGDRELVLVGVDRRENDMLDLVVDVSLLCPIKCSEPNALNSDG